MTVKSQTLNVNFYLFCGEFGQLSKCASSSESMWNNFVKITTTVEQ